MPRVPRRDYSTAFARALRKSMSEAEIRLWFHLRRRFSAKFRRQEPVGPYITDFCCYEARLVVEVDGEQHRHTVAYDRRRDKYLRSEGFAVLRLSAYDVIAHLDWVLDRIGTALADRMDRDP